MPSAGAVGGERLPVRPAWLLERELDLELYERETDCDWTSGSFMFARREALESAGFMDERFFIYSEEPDLCLRLKGAGWEIRHLPQMTIVHHAGKAGIRPRMSAQDAYTRMQLARKHFSPLHRVELRDRSRTGISRAGSRSRTGARPPDDAQRPARPFACSSASTGLRSARRRARLLRCEPSAISEAWRDDA